MSEKKIQLSKKYWECACDSPYLNHRKRTPICPDCRMHHREGADARKEDLKNQPWEIRGKIPKKFLLPFIDSQLKQIESWRGSAYLGPSLEDQCPDGDDVYIALKQIRKAIQLGVEDYRQEAKKENITF